MGLRAPPKFQECRHLAIPLFIVEVKELHPSQMSRPKHHCQVGIPIEATAGQHCLVGFLLHPGQLVHGEITHGEWVSHAESVDGLIEHLGPSGGEAAAIDYPGIIVALGLQSCELVLLVHGGFVAAQVFDGAGTLDMGNGDCLAVFANDLEWGRGCVFIHHSGGSILLELEVNDVVFAFGKFEFLVGGGEDVVPELTIFASLFQQGFQGCCESHSIHGGPQIGPVIDVINEPQ